MVALPKTFNTADLPDTGGMPLIPPGDYKAVIVDSEMKATSNNLGQFLALKIVLTEGPYAHTEFTERLNIINQNQKAVEIAYRTLARIAEAVGMTQTPSDSVQLHNRPFIARIETEAGKPYTDKDGVQRDGKDKSVIGKYLPLPGVAAASQPATATPFATSPQAAAAPAAKPWGPGQ